MTPRRGVAAVLLAAVLVLPVPVAEGSHCTNAADERVKACSRAEPGDAPVAVPVLVEVRLEEGTTVPAPVRTDWIHAPPWPRVPGTPRPPDAPGLPSVIGGDAGDAWPLLVLLDADAWHDAPHARGDVRVSGYLVVAGDFVPVNVRAQWVDDNEDGVPDAIALQGPFALIVPLVP